MANLLVRSNAEAAKQGFPADEATAEEFLAAEILTGMAAGAVEWRLGAVPFSSEVGVTPSTTPLARLHAERGYKITTLRGDSVTLDEITDALIATLKRGEMVLQREGDNNRP